MAEDAGAAEVDPSRAGHVMLDTGVDHVSNAVMHYATSIRLAGVIRGIDLVGIELPVRELAPQGTGRRGSARL